MEESEGVMVSFCSAIDDALDQPVSLHASCARLQGPGHAPWGASHGALLNVDGKGGGEPSPGPAHWTLHRNASVLLNKRVSLATLGRHQGFEEHSHELSMEGVALQYRGPVYK